MTLTPFQTFIVILMLTLGTVITRFLPFILFHSNRERNPYIIYLGKVLPSSVIGLLVVFCLKNINILSPKSWLPEALAIFLITMLHLWKRNVFISIGVGTIFYMLLVQVVFN